MGQSFTIFSRWVLEDTELAGYKLEKLQNSNSFGFSK